MYNNIIAGTAVSLGNCPKPCTQKTFDILTTKRDRPGLSDNQSTMVLYYPNNQTRIEAEYELFGLTSIIASVGGSMGLFLGFSCLDSAMSLLEKVITKFQA